MAASFNRGAAIFSSQSEIVLEALERRTHLAATPFSAYWPLKVGTEWVYNQVDDGKHSTSTEKIVPGTEAVNGQRAFQRRVEEENGSWTILLENLSAAGRVQIHRIRDSSTQTTLTPGWAFPKYAKVGQRSAMQGEAEFVLNSIRFRGDYHFDAEVLKMETVKVAAGTCSTVKIRVSDDIAVEYHKNGQNRTIRFTGTAVQWYAKGIGRVKEIGTTHVETNINGRHREADGSLKDALRSYTAAPT